MARCLIEALNCELMAPEQKSWRHSGLDINTASRFGLKKNGLWKPWKL